MKKALVSLVLVLCLMAGTAMAENVNLESAMPVVKEKISVSIAVRPQGSAVNFSPESNWFCQYLDKFSNLDINWILLDPSTADERVPIMLNSDEMPDAIWGQPFNPNNLVQYGQIQNIFRPVNDLIQYMPAFSAYLDEHPITAQALKASDGNMYGFPAFPNVYNYTLAFFVNNKWLKNVGLEQPNTLAEFKDMLIAFRDQDANGNGDPNDEIPWTGAWDTEQSERCFILSAYGYVKNNSGKDNLFLDTHAEERTLVYLPLEERYKDYLQYMHELWEEGLIDHDMFTQSETQVQAICMDNKTGFSSMSAPYEYAPENQEAWDAINLLVDQEGHTPAMTGPKLFVATYFVMNADCDDEKAAALANLADFCYTLEAYGFLTYGPEAGTDLDWNNNGHYYDAESNTIMYNMPADLTSTWVHRVTNLSLWLSPGFHTSGYNPYKLEYAKVYPDSAIGQLFKDGVVDRRDEEQLKLRSKYYVDAIPDFFFTPEDQERATELSVPLDDYAFSMEARFITGEASIENDYDTFIETLKAYGAEEYIALCNKYFSGN